MALNTLSDLDCRRCCSYAWSPTGEPTGTPRMLRPPWRVPSSRLVTPASSMGMPSSRAAAARYRQFWRLYSGDSVREHRSGGGGRHVENECRRQNEERKAANGRRRSKSGPQHKGSHKAANKRPQRDPHRKHIDTPPQREVAGHCVWGGPEKNTAKSGLAVAIQNKIYIDSLSKP